MTRTLLRFCIALGLAFGLGWAAAANTARAQDYPARRITIVCAFAAGGSVDAAARIIAEKLRERWGIPVVVENRLGAAGNIAAAAVARATPDGGTLLLTASGVAINQSLYVNPGYSIKELRPLSLPAVNSSVMAIHPDNSARTLQQFFDAHRAKGFVYGASGVGSGAQITAAYMFKDLAKVDAVLTPYQGGAPAATALMGKHIDLISVALPDIATLVQTGKLRALGVSGAERSEALPDVPTYSEAGFPGYVVYGWTAAMAPAGISDELAGRLNAAINDILAMPDVKQKLEAVGFAPNRQSLPDTEKRLAADVASWAKMVSALGLQIK
ncbi:MAG TPA: tripartite tricarboxylate transporter substrate-binding protein [Xanthobacteraceae bacterium]|nr:tripartite tricarboxylate transporter substrate-binding protein [Xanthobacteraceae bacterium]